jgi:hypothetical protein
MAKRAVRIALLMSLAPAAVWSQTPFGLEFQVNTFTTGYQTHPSVAADASGNFLVVWDGYGQDDGGFGVFGQRYDSSGSPQGAELHINSFTTGNQRWPAVAWANGSFVVVWQSNLQDGSGYGVFGQRYDAGGTPQGPEFPVNSSTPNGQSRPAMASDPNGNFVVVWDSSLQDGNGLGVFGQRFDATATPQGAEFQVNTFVTGNQSGASVALDPAGDFVVVWSSPQDGSSFGVFGQRYDASGSAQGPEFRVNTFTTFQQYAATVAKRPDGSFFVAWAGDGQDGNMRGVFAQRYDASGVPQGGEFRVNSHTTDAQAAPKVAADADGDFVVLWISSGQDGSSNGIFGQRYNPSGGIAGGEFRVNSYTTSSQFYPSIAFNGTDRFVVAWSSFGQDGSSWGVFGQRFGPPPDLIFEDGFE